MASPAQDADALPAGKRAGDADEGGGRELFGDAHVHVRERSMKCEASLSSTDIVRA